MSPVKLPQWCRHGDCQETAGYGPNGRYCERHARSLVWGGFAVAVGMFLLLCLAAYAVSRIG